MLPFSFIRAPPLQISRCSGYPFPLNSSTKFITLLREARSSFMNSTRSCAVVSAPNSSTASARIFCSAYKYEICQRLILLPTAYEVWGKVMFLHVPLILFTGGDVSIGAGGGGWYVQEGFSISPPYPHPPRYAEIRLTAGRYKSYWNVFLLSINVVVPR